MRIAPFVGLLFVAGRLTAQQPSRPAVSGTVRDSLTGTPLAGAIVQLVVDHGGAMLARAATSDSLGRFTIADVPDGRHLIGFVHPLLDSLGLEPPQREILVTGQQQVRADLGTPSPRQFRQAICKRAGGPALTVISGIVRDARTGTPLADVQVTAEWMEVVFGARMRAVRRLPRHATTTAANGWFALCDVPGKGSVMIVADHGADSTDVIEVQVPDNGFLRRDMYLGATRSHVETPRPGDSLARPARRIRAGDARLSGKLIAAVDGRPLGGAQVGIVDGPQTRTNERGEWTLIGAPSGTRVLEARAVGYYPVRRAVDIVGDAAPVSVSLSTFKAMLDTVRITSARLADQRNSGFEDRRRTGLGQYITPADIERHQPQNMAQILRRVPGVRLDRTPVEGMPVFDTTGTAIPQSTISDNKILLRASAGEWCYPAVYINGQYMRDLDADDLDAWARPREILGIEVYAGISAPVQFQQGRTGCGSILIWTK